MPEQFIDRRFDQRQLKLFQRQLKLFSMTIETPVL